MGEPVEVVALFSLSQGWLAGCFVAALWCGLRARGQGYSGALFASTGLFLGLGAVPVTWLATRQEIGERDSGMGLTPESVSPNRNEALLRWLSFYQSRRQLLLGGFLGVGGLVLHATQSLTHVLPQLFAFNSSHYRPGQPGGPDWEMVIRTVWVVLSLGGPTLAYFAVARLPRPRSLDLLWVYYARQSDPDLWRQLIPGRLHSLSSLTPAEALDLRRSLNQQVLRWPAWLIPACLLVIFAMVALLSALGFQAYKALSH